MAKWSGNKVNPEQINNGNEYTVNDNVSIEELNGIVNNSFKAQKDAEQALELATGANEANGTVVKINGEPQGTWDATFSQELYDESANIFQIPDTPETTKNGITYSIKDGVITLNGTATDWTSIYKDKNLEVEEGGWSARLFYNSNEIPSGLSVQFQKSDGSNFIQINKNNNANGFSASIKRDIVNIVANVGTVLNNVKISLLIKNGKDIADKYYSYNPNRHITNSEAEYLKEEHDKQSNLLPLENKEYSFEATSQYGFVRVPLGQDYTLKAGTYVLDFKMKAGSDTGVFNKFSFDYGTTSKFVVGTQSSVSTSYSNINRTFTLSEDITYNAIWIQVAKIGNYSFKEVFVGKKFKEYQPYNSSSHITNAQADLLKSEYDKSVNELEVYGSVNSNVNGLDFSLLQSGEININGTATSNGWYEFITTFGTTEATTTKKYSLDSTQSYTFSSNEVSLLPTGCVIKLQINSSGTTMTLNREVNKETRNDCDGVYRGWIYIPQGSSFNNARIKLQLEKGSVATEWHEWNGSIIHKKDITPVLLWENATPNANFIAQDITVNDLNEYNKVTVVYKVMAYSDSLPLEMTFDIEYDSYSYLIGTALDALGTLLSRAFKITNNTTIRFGSGNRGSTTETNNFCIPVAVYGVK